MSAQPTATRPVPIPASDQTWLHMDRPNNLMYVRSLMWFDDPLDVDLVRTVLRERLVERHPVFHRRAVEHDGAWFWEDDEDFDLERHVRTVRLEGGETELRAWIGAQFSVPFDHDHPLWTVDLVTGVEGYGTIMFSRFHHALADGIRLTQLLFSMCDPVTEGAPLPVPVGRGRRPRGLLGVGTSVVRRSAGDAGDLVVGALRIPLRAATALDPRRWPQAGALVLHPRRMFDLVESLVSQENQSVNTLTEMSRMLSAPRSAATSWSGTPGVEKGVSWVTGLDLAAVKRVGRRHGGTVNDVLLALVSLALTRYLAEKDALVDEIAWLVPVSLVPFDADLPEELGNHFSLVFLPMPLALESAGRAVSEMQARMRRIKNSAEPVITFGVQWAIAESPKALASRFTNLFANKGVGVLTNVPGPRGRVAFAGRPVAGTLGWAPTSGDQPLGLCIFSYDGQVNIGIAGDAGLVPDPDRIAALVAEEFARMTS